MDSQPAVNQPTSLEIGFLWLLRLLVVVGVVWRLSALVQGVPKLFSFDEAVTIIQSAGGGNDRLGQSFESMKEPVRVGDARILATAPQSLWGVVKTMAREDAEHPPLYYSLSHLWMLIFGASIRSIRGLSCVFGLLQIPVVVFLFRRRGKGAMWVAAALTAVSAILFNYSIEARDQALFFMMVFATLAAFSSRSWRALTVLFLISLYTSLFAIPMIAGLVVSTYARDFEPRDRVRVLKSSCVALLGLSPWLAIVWIYRDRVNLVLGWQKNPSIAKTVWSYVDVISQLLSHSYFQIGVGASSLFGFAKGPLIVFSLISLAAVGAGLWWSARFARANWMAAFALCCVVINFLALLIPDLLLDGSRIIAMRYWILTFAVSLISVIAWSLSLRPRLQVLVVVTLGCMGLSSMFFTATDAIQWTNRGLSYSDDVEALRAHPGSVVAFDGTYLAAGLLFSLPDDMRIEPIDHLDLKLTPQANLFSLRFDRAARTEIKECYTNAVCRLGL